MTDLFSPRQRQIAYLITAVGNGALIPLQTSPDVDLPLWAVCAISAWNAAVAALALSNTPSTPAE